MRPSGFGSPDTVWFGSDFDGAFAQYALVPASEVFAVDGGLGDAELAAVPCSYGTAENMLLHAGVRPGQHVVVTGASGGVGSAAVQLAALRGAEVTAVTSQGKEAAVLELGATRAVDRDDPRGALGEAVGGRGGGQRLGTGIRRLPLAAAPRRRLRHVGRHRRAAGHPRQADPLPARPDPQGLHGVGRGGVPVARGAHLDATSCDRLVAATFPLERIAEAQTEFAEKRHVGSYVLVPPGV